MMKCALVVCGEDVKTACGSSQLCAGLETGIEGAIHAVAAGADATNTMKFREWELNDDICEEMAKTGEV